MTGRAWAWPVAGVLLAPLVTWLPMPTVHFGLPLPAYPPAQGIDLWQLHALWFVLFGLVAAIVGPGDRWLAVALGMAGLTIFLRGATMNVMASLMFALGALALWAVRQTPEARVPALLRVLAGCGAFQAVYVLQQKYLAYDFFWGPWFGGVPTPTIQPLGTLGTVDATSAFIAITSSLMPWWLLPVAFWAVLTSQSMGANAALLVGLAVTYGPRLYRRAPWSPAVLGAGLAGFVWYFLTSVKSTDAVWPRLDIWRAGLVTAYAQSPVFGWGLGGWELRRLVYQPTGEYFREAHSEWVQWACEAGLVGLIVLTGWLWRHRAMFTHPRLGGAVTALAVTCGSFFTLHTVATGFLAVVVIGLATAPRAPAFSQEA